ncbi:hypothetical protein LTR56_005221 [Elasticomyces elasticus]|nr:hypothetical protein LTR56_005221 [Elasticomyces elasticus]KAK3656512.1 hypothetical protein LTR22_009785 [Elasticomyces elasticus]KAK4923598.1 hypothetical protein LTR49_009153 [Elasticomyces elasticus]KAK5762116.1 hypothetical protein LTS12_007813 [Elasticomyces elasticus]
MPAHLKLADAKTYIEEVLSYTFNNIDYLEEALWACPAEMQNGRQLPDGNKSLAVVGDAMLHLVVVHYCYVRGMARGPANDAWKKVACNEYLAALPHAVGVARFVNMNAGMTAMSEYMKATAVEAIFGAVFNDCRGDYHTLLKAVTAMGAFAGLESDEE